jgi:superfamily II DNA or RNA helicase
MQTFPPDVSFRFTWRSYQARVLGELEAHLDDNTLHVVAAPGSGKTVLGLEAMKRLNHPTLILSPTLTIRNQWIDRLVGLFLPPGSDRPDWVSTDIRAPRLMTVATYQALHMALTGRDESSGDEGDDVARDGSADEARGRPVDLGRICREAGIRVMIVDECHHLRSAWWKSLVQVRDALEAPTVVALTATPPYDVPPHEWDRYRDLCGPVDAEIPVPELVREGNLCPHQDYILFSTPTSEEHRRIREFREGVREFRDDLVRDEDFAAAAKGHPWVTDPEARMEGILDDPAYASSMAIFLNAARGEPPDRLVSTLGLKGARVPALDLEWLETLLTGCLYGDPESYEAHAEHLDGIRRRLSRLGAVERRRVQLRNTREVARALAGSMSKMDSIGRIAALEHDALGDDLRMVVLTDFIRKAHLPRSPDDLKPITRMGVVPIFEQLRRHGPRGLKLGVLSGSFVVIPRSAEGLLRESAGAFGIPAGRLSLHPLRADDGYLEFDMVGEDRERIVRVMTEVFSRGGITVLVGTKALLGEGWDAPSVNTLVLATFVGSYMLSNQMRGRAIRVQADRPQKVADIWHLVCVEPDDPEMGPDIHTLTRRFKAFVGVSLTETLIENGIGRMGIGEPPFSNRRIREINGLMEERARDRGGLRAAWEEALALGEEGVRLVQEVAAPEAVVPRGFLFRNTIKALIWEGLFLGGAVYSQVLGSVRFEGTPSTRAILTLIGIALGLGALVFLVKLGRAGWLFLRYGPVASQLRDIGEALLRALFHAGAVRTSPNRFRVRVERGDYGLVYCSLEGGSSYEKSVFIGALEELLNPIENPRYLLMRRSVLGPVHRADYHTVPQELGRRKENAEYLATMWRKYVGGADVVYTRSPEGRRVLLAARSRSLAAAFRPRAEQISRWK